MTSYSLKQASLSRTSQSGGTVAWQEIQTTRCQMWDGRPADYADIEVAAVTTCNMPGQWARM